MNCFRARKWILLYAEADLPARRSQRLEAHLDKCATCKKEIEEIRAALAGVQTVADKGTLDWPEAEWMVLMARIKSERPGPRPKSALQAFPRKSWAYGLALVLILVAAVLIRKIVPSPPPIPLLTEIMMPTPAQPLRALRTDEATSAGHPRDLPFRVYERREGPDRVLLAAGPAPDKAAQDMMSMTLVSQETGLKVHWTFNRDFDWEEKKK